MAEGRQEAPPPGRSAGWSLPKDGLGRTLHELASAYAILGGVVLALMAVLVVVSVMGRTLFDRPVPGDFEIVGLGTAIAIFLFLPFCYVQGGNVAVDIFIRRTPAAVRRIMDAFAAIVFGTVAALFAWRMLLGLMDVVHYADVSMILGLPLWWAYPFGIASFLLLAVSAFYGVFRGRGRRP